MAQSALTITQFPVISLSSGPSLEPDRSRTRPDQTDGLLIWNDLSNVLGYLRVASDSGHATAVTVEAAPATVDHSDIRGSKPHGRHPSGATSD